MDDGPQVSCVGLDQALGDLVADRARAALAALAMGDDLARLVICADDLAAGGPLAAGPAVTGDEAWYGRVAGDTGPGRALTLYCPPAVFLAARAEGEPPGPPAAVWERTGGRAEAPPPTAADFARGRSDVFLHHHLLTVRDLLRRDLAPRLVPGSLAEAFTAAWAITVDGRLERAGLPGHPLDERRRRFSRLFSQAGILMPVHWQVFQELWDGPAPAQREVLRQVRRLPRL
jgi:hypothetical protein